MDNKIYEGLKVYFEHLKNFGYMKLGTLYSLVVYIWLAEMVLNYCDMLSDALMARIQSIIRCLENKLCMIPKTINCNLNITINDDLPKKSTCV